MTHLAFRSCLFTVRNHVRLGMRSACFAPLQSVWIRSVLTVWIIALACGGTTVSGQDLALDRLGNGLKPLLDIVSGRSAEFHLSVEATIPIDGRPQVIQLDVSRFDDQSFDFRAAHPDYSVNVLRRGDVTMMALPHHKVAFVGRGTSDKTDHLTPLKLMDRIISDHSTVRSYSVMLANSDPLGLAAVLTNIAKLQFDPATSTWSGARDLAIQVRTDQAVIDVRSQETHVRLQFSAVGPLTAVALPDGYREVVLEREELESQLVRGVRRATEVFAPAPILTSPTRTNRKTEHGELRWIDGQRVALLRGTPEQIGMAHGQLLRDEAERCIDSVLNAFGTVQTIRTGRWFRQDLDDAYAQLSPHIPERHKRETRAMAASLGLPPARVEALNVFPELFHCSGFAVFGSATSDGKLYHGRVLDYMTTIGLQDSATTFIVAADGKIPFANIGYAGFIGSVSGMNANAISLGEMGGRGEGQWNGVPMATLMRRALEECSTLDDVMTLWKDNPRTCEYFYVFADGKTNRAVGVAALPESVEFILPGQTHERLGTGIEDAVVLSAGSRLETLRGRVQEKHGSIDAEIGQWLMSRPVAMQSNLHNVLFVPVDGIFYVANADHKHPAAERPYARFNLHELLESMPGRVPTVSQSTK